MVRRTVLLCCDFQNDIIDALPPDNVPKVITAAHMALKAARNAGIPVIHTGVCFRPGYPEVSEDNKQFKGIQGSGQLIDGTPGAMFVADMTPLPNEPVVVKRRVGAHHDTELPAILRALCAVHVVIMGVSTSGVVLSTVRWLSDADYVITALDDCCADKDEEVHLVLMKKVLSRQATVLSCAEFANQL